MSNKEQEMLNEIRGVYARMDELKRNLATSQATLVSREKALEKAKEKVDEAKAAVRQAESEVNSFSVEQKKAIQKIMTVIAKDPSLGHEFLGKALTMTPGSDENQA